MNSTTTPTGNPERLAENPQEIFQNLSRKEQEFIENNIKSFENFFATNPTAAIKSFLVPEHANFSGATKMWNIFIQKQIENFTLSNERNRENFLENFYKMILGITKTEPSAPMQYRSGAKGMTANIISNS